MDIRETKINNSFLEKEDNSIQLKINDENERKELKKEINKMEKIVNMIANEQAEQKKQYYGPFEFDCCQFTVAVIWVIILFKIFY